MSFHDEIKDTIAKYGVQLLGVGGEGTSPPFAYTIGLTPKFGVEILMVGLPLKYVGPILNSVAARATLPALDVPNPDFANLPLMFKRCTKDLELLHDEFVVQSDVFYDQQVDVVQLVMPDKAGLFPSDPGFDHPYMDPRQRLFCEF